MLLPRLGIGRNTRVGRDFSGADRAAASEHENRTLKERPHGIDPIAGERPRLHIRLKRQYRVSTPWLGELEIRWAGRLRGNLVCVRLARPDAELDTTHLALIASGEKTDAQLRETA